MSHANARLTVHGRALLVRRVRVDRRPVAHVAKELGVSRQCAHRWVARFDAGGLAALADRSSRPRRSPGRTPAAVEARVLAERVACRRGPDFIAVQVGVPARTVSRILSRHRVPHLADCDPLTGALIRAGRHSSIRYERARPGELVHIDVKKIGRIPDGGGWRAHGRASTAAQRQNTPRSASTTSTPPSMTTPGWPTPRSCPMRRARPAPASSPAPPRSSPPTASPGSNGSSATTPTPTGPAASSAPPPPHSAPDNGSSARTAPGPTGRSSGSTAPCRPNGPTGRCSPPTPTGPRHSTPGSPSTTLNADTLRSAAYPRPADCHQPDGRVQLGASM